MNASAHESRMLLICNPRQIHTEGILTVEMGIDRDIMISAVGKVQLVQLHFNRNEALDLRKLREVWILVFH